MAILDGDIVLHAYAFQPRAVLADVGARTVPQRRAGDVVKVFVWCLVRQNQEMAQCTGNPVETVYKREWRPASPNT